MLDRSHRTFMLGGDICTRHCGFCAVGKGQPGSLDPEEPRHVAEAVGHLNLAHAVITSVNRDDLPDGGAAHWAETIRQVRALNPECKIEVLIPDFNGDEAALNTVLDAEPTYSTTILKRSRVSIVVSVPTRSTSNR
jgi:lipoic acid synthetase